MTPPLTSVRVPIAALGESAMERLSHLMGGQVTDDDWRRDVLPAKLVIRASAAPRPPRVPEQPASFPDPGSLLAAPQACLTELPGAGNVFMKTFSKPWRSTAAPGMTRLSDPARRPSEPFDSRCRAPGRRLGHHRLPGAQREGAGRGRDPAAHPGSRGPLDYVPHGGARSLITRRTGTIGVLLPDLYGEFFSELHPRHRPRGAAERPPHPGVELAQRPREVEAVLRALRGRVDGLIVMSPEDEAPCLAANLLGRAAASSCWTAGAEGGGLRLDHHRQLRRRARHDPRICSALGHRRIAHVTGRAEQYRRRASGSRGYRDALRPLFGGDAGAARAEGDFSEESGDRAAGLRSPSCASARRDLRRQRHHGDRLPPGASRSAGLQGARRISRWPASTTSRSPFPDPPLTTVGVPIAELGAPTAVESCAEILATGAPASTARTFTHRARGPRLVRRAAFRPQSAPQARTQDR